MQQNRLAGSGGTPAPKICWLGDRNQNCCPANISLSGVDIRTFRVLREISDLPGVIRELTAAVRSGVELLAANGPGEARLEALERYRATFEAEMEGLVLKADGRYKAAAASEARSRVMEKNAQKLADPFLEESDEIQNGIPPQYAEVGPPEGVHEMPLDLAPRNSKALAQRAKFL